MIRSTCTAICVTLFCSQLMFAQVVHDENFDSSDGGYTVTDQGNPTGPWTYNSEAGTWFTNGTDNNGAPSHTRLTSPAVGITKDGPVELSFFHFYSIEGELWDGGAVFVSLNSGDFTQIPGSDFLANGYTGVGLIGNHDLNGGEGFEWRFTRISRIHHERGEPGNVVHRRHGRRPVPDGKRRICGRQFPAQLADRPSHDPTSSRTIGDPVERARHAGIDPLPTRCVIGASPHRILSL